MAKVVFDVETVGCDFETLDDTSKEYFLKFAKTPEDVEEAKNSLNFYPLTAEIVAIGMLEVETEQGIVYFQNGSQQKERFVEGTITYIAGQEKEMLHYFWTQLNRYDQFITFNGRAFDGPFLMIRSAMHGIRALKNLVPYRYATSAHIDLADQLSFYDAVRRKFGLHMWCQAFGIESPKEEGITGLQVKDFFKQGRCHEIARYCMRDIKATKELYSYWEKYLKS